MRNYMRDKKRFVFAAAIAIIFLFTGCGKEKAPQMDTVSVQKDGTIKHTIVGQFERHYYDTDGISELAREKASDYGMADSVVCESVENNEGKIIIKMSYQTGEDYTNYNNRELFSGTVSEAYAQGYSFADMVGKDGNGVEESEISSAGENHVVIVQTNPGEELDVNVYDKILYVSGHVTLSGKTDALITGSEEEQLSYIIFQ